jgi:hypothetical protein
VSECVLCGKLISLWSCQGHFHSLCAHLELCSFPCISVLFIFGSVLWLCTPSNKWCAICWNSIPPLFQFFKLITCWARFSHPAHAHSVQTGLHTSAQAYQTHEDSFQVLFSCSKTACEHVVEKRLSLSPPLGFLSTGSYRSESFESPAVSIRLGVLVPSLQWIIGFALLCNLRLSLKQWDGGIN